jgi:uncharacterized membrane protein
VEKYRKFIVAIVTVVLVGVNTFFGKDLGIPADSIANVILTVLGALGVWAVPNAPAA